MYTNGKQDIITLNRGKGLKKKKTNKQTKNYEKFFLLAVSLLPV